MSRSSNTISLDEGVMESGVTGLHYNMLDNYPFPEVNSAGHLFKESSFDNALGWNPDRSPVPEISAMTATGVTGSALHSECGQKSFPCVEPGCLRVFPRQSELRKHEKTHVNETERPHQCPTCAKRFLYRKDVKRHAQSKHWNPNEPLQKYPCPYSGCVYAAKGFYRKDKLLRHVQKQHVEKDRIQQRKADVEVDAVRLREAQDIGCFTTEKDDETDPTPPELSRSTNSILSMESDMTDSICPEFSHPQILDLDMVGWDSLLEQ